MGQRLRGRPGDAGKMALKMILASFPQTIKKIIYSIY
jgi:hypothetical protein